MGCTHGKVPAAVPSQPMELARVLDNACECKSGEPTTAMVEPSPTNVLLGRSRLEPREPGQEADKVTYLAAGEAEAKPQADTDEIGTSCLKPEAPERKQAAPLHVVGTTPTNSRPRAKGLEALGSTADSKDLLLGVQLACLAYIDDEPGTIDNLAGAKEAIEAIAGGSDQARKPLTGILAHLGFTVDRMFSHAGIFGDGAFNDTQGFIAHNERDVVLAYRGTVSFTDALTDLLAGHVPFRPAKDENRGSAWMFSCCAAAGGADDLGRAHRGFYGAFMSSLPDIEEVLLPLLSGPKPKRLILAGHSLGGAIATGALAYLLKRLDLAASRHRLLFVTIGQPRFGDQRFAAWVDAEVQKLRKLGRCVAARIVHAHDGVPLVPPQHFGYGHVSEMCLLTAAGDLLVDPELLESGSAERVGEYLEDHNPHSYLSLVAAHALDRLNRV